MVVGFLIAISLGIVIRHFHYGWYLILPGNDGVMFLQEPCLFLGLSE